MRIVKPKSNQATILIITLWVLTLLSAIALSLTYRMGIELKIATSELNRDKALPIAKAGVIQAISVLAQDTNPYDYLSEAWSNCSPEYSINFFRDIPVGEGKFNVSYVYEKSAFGGEQIFYGMVDEERKININKAKQDVLQSFFNSPEIAMSIRAWRGDSDPEITGNILPKEDAYYQALPKPYKCKGKPFDCVEELTLVHGITSEMLFGKDLNGDGIISADELGLIKYLTIYGDGEGRININTADVAVLRAINFTQDLIDRIIRFRQGQDEILGTVDDNYFSDVSQIKTELSGEGELSQEEQVLINNAQALLTVSSQYYTAYVEGSISDSVKSNVTAILDKGSSEGNQITRWCEE